MSTFTADTLRESSTSSQLSPPRSSLTAAAGQLALDALLVTGHRHTFRVASSATIFEVRHHIWTNWPPVSTPDDDALWPQRPAHPSHLRILHLGSFLSDDVTLASRNLTPSRRNVVHIVIKASPTQGSSGSNDDIEPVKKSEMQTSNGSAPSDAVSTGCCCIVS